MKYLACHKKELIMLALGLSLLYYGWSQNLMEQKNLSAKRQTLEQPLVHHKEARVRVAH